MSDFIFILLFSITHIDTNNNYSINTIQKQIEETKKNKTIIY